MVIKSFSFYFYNNGYYLASGNKARLVTGPDAGRGIVDKHSVGTKDKKWQTFAY